MSVYCEKCQTAEAVVHVTELRGGEKIERHLCEECAESQDGIPEKGGGSLSMLHIFQQFVEKTGASKRTRERNCECGMTFSEFKAKGRFGCAEDYDLFFDRLLPLLARIHGADAHVPEGGGPSVRAAPDQRGDELRRLRGELQVAVDGEAYEDAAGIRDRIQQLERGESRSDESAPSGPDSDGPETTGQERETAG